MAKLTKADRAGVGGWYRFDQMPSEFHRRAAETLVRDRLSPDRPERTAADYMYQFSKAGTLARALLATRFVDGKLVSTGGSNSGVPASAMAAFKALIAADAGVDADDGAAPVEDGRGGVEGAGPPRAVRP